MEGNECYKYKTLKEFLQRINHPKISTIIEIGVNYGHQTAEMLGYFPDARILGFEPVPDICQSAKDRFIDQHNVVILPLAVTAEHIYTDDLGTQTHPQEMPLSLFVAQPEFGGGWQGSHRVRSPDYAADPIKFKRAEIAIEPITLDGAVALALTQFKTHEIDFIKTDCEGSECSFLGCASPDTLKRIRYIAGEYHDIERFYKATETLRETHYVNLIGGGYLGCFFAERKTELDSLLCKEPLPVERYPHLCKTPLSWNVFDSRWINKTDLNIHGLKNDMPCNCNKPGGRNIGRMKKFMPLNAENAPQLVAEHLLTIRTTPSRTYTGRGIIICGGGLKYIPGLWVTIRLLRDHGCTLPIQVWQLAGETDKAFEALCKPYNVEFVDASSLEAAADHPRLNGWELKSFAAIHSPFAEVLLLDADNVPTTDPTYLFDDAGYQTTGCIAWPDFGRLAPPRPAWTVSGVGYQDEPEWESGQLLINKNKCWKALCLADWFNRQSNFFFEYWHGDKESFHLGFRRTDTPYTMIAKPIRGIEATMIQHDPQGNEIFYHRNMGKFSLTDNKRVSGFFREDVCLQLIEELRQQWANHIPVLSDEDKKQMNSLQLRRYQYIRINHDEREMELLPNGRIGKGQASLECQWYVKNNQLILLGEKGEITAILQPATTTDWAGKWVVHEQMPIYMLCKHIPAAPVR